MYIGGLIMEQNKMYLINKIFNNETIRTVWDRETEKYYISIVDIVTVITESKDGRKNQREKLPDTGECNKIYGKRAFIHSFPAMVPGEKESQERYRTSGAVTTL